MRRVRERRSFRPSLAPAGSPRAAGLALKPAEPTTLKLRNWKSTSSATWGGRGLRFCAALSFLRRLPDFVDLIAEATPDCRCCRLAGRFHGLSSALAPRCIPARGEAMLGERG